jgi:hypothetical protein
MSQSEEYKRLQAQYIDFKRQAVSAIMRRDSEASQVLEQTAVFEQKILEFGLANGYDLNELRKFFSDVDWGIAMELSAG